MVWILSVKAPEISISEKLEVHSIAAAFKMPGLIVNKKNGLS